MSCKPLVTNPFNPINGQMSLDSKVVQNHRRKQAPTDLVNTAALIEDLFDVRKRYDGIGRRWEPPGLDVNTPGKQRKDFLKDSLKSVFQQGPVYQHVLDEKGNVDPNKKTAVDMMRPLKLQRPDLHITNLNRNAKDIANLMTPGTIKNNSTARPKAMITNIRYHTSGNPYSAIPESAGDARTECDVTTEGGSGKMITPSWIAYNQQVLSWKAYFLESVQDSSVENYRVRTVQVNYYLEDGTLSVEEPKIGNSGLIQGRVIARARILKDPTTSTLANIGHHEEEIKQEKGKGSPVHSKNASSNYPYVHWTDLKCGSNLSIYGRVMRLAQCDNFTKRFYESEGVDCGEFEEIPKDVFTEHYRARKLQDIKTTAIAAAKKNNNDLTIKNEAAAGAGSGSGYYVTEKQIGEAMSTGQGPIADLINPIHQNCLNEGDREFHELALGGTRKNVKLEQYLSNDRKILRFYAYCIDQKQQLGVQKLQSGKDAGVAAVLRAQAKEDAKVAAEMEKADAEKEQAETGMTQAQLDEQKNVMIEASGNSAAGEADAAEGGDTQKFVEYVDPDFAQKLANAENAPEEHLSNRGVISYYIINFFLADDSIQINERQFRNSGRDAWPTLFKRAPLRKNPVVSATPGLIEPTPILYMPQDLVIGKKVDVYGRILYIYGCDEFTRYFFRKRYKMELVDENLRESLAKKGECRQFAKGIKAVVTRESRPGAAHEISSGTIYTITNNAEVVATDVSGTMVLRFECVLDNCSLIDKNRRFILSYDTKSGLLSVWELKPVQNYDLRNSGHRGGKFIERLKNQSIKAEGTTFYTGNIIKLAGVNFKLGKADEYTLRYMEQQQDYPYSNIYLIGKKILDGARNFIVKLNVDAGGNHTGRVVVSNNIPIRGQLESNGNENSMVKIESTTKMDSKMKTGNGSSYYNDIKEKGNPYGMIQLPEGTVEEEIEEPMVMAAPLRNIGNVPGKDYKKQSNTNYDVYGTGALIKKPEIMKKTRPIGIKNDLGIVITSSGSTKNATGYAKSDTVDLDILKQGPSDALAGLPLPVSLTGVLPIHSGIVTFDSRGNTTMRRLDREDTNDKIKSWRNVDVSKLTIESLIFPSNQIRPSAAPFKPAGSIAGGPPGSGWLFQSKAEHKDLVEKFHARTITPQVLFDIFKLIGIELNEQEQVQIVRECGALNNSAIHCEALLMTLDRVEGKSMKWCLNRGKDVVEKK